jgi:3-hydroxyacyl-CoA dehydrogenase/enoyl-CoA hydratase/3-hydroxybutyryl-CoA epimerase
MPVSPLALADDVGSNLINDILRQTQHDLGAAYVKTDADHVIHQMVNIFGRTGKRSGAGFYEYPIGGPKRLWTELHTHFHVSTHQPTLQEVQNRLLIVQTIEALRCLEEKILESKEAGDVGSVLGWGFPLFTGGVLSFINYMGISPFQAAASELGKKYGVRFQVPRIINEFSGG